MSDEIDPTIVPDPEDPGDEFTLPTMAELDDAPVDPDAADSPECDDDGDHDRKEDNRE